MRPTEENCQGCPFSTLWGGQYGNACAPACSHPQSGPRAVNLLDEMESCPEGRV